MKLVLLQLVFLLANLNACWGEEVRRSNKYAYVTMLYTVHGDMYVDGFEIGVRVLGQSLRESKTQHDYVVLCSEDVPEKVKKVLETDGWIVKPLKKNDIHLGDNFNENAWKLSIWKLTEYSRIVFLDADAIVVKNVDELFHCGSFCAVFRHSDLFNSGVMVIQPSETELVSMTKTMKNFTGKWFHNTFGDQVILNQHFKDLKKATMFDPQTSQQQSEPMRLASGYNADIGMYYLNDGFTAPNIKVIHYTLGIVKPMLWWTYPLFDLNWRWDELRGRLPTKFHEPSMFAFQHWLPALLMISVFVSFRACAGTYKYVYRHRLMIKLNVLLVPGSCGWFVAAFPLLIQTLSLIFTIHSIPVIMRPRPAWCLAGMWYMFYMALFYSFYCRYLYDVGESFGARFMSVQAARIETLMHSILFLFIFTLLFYIPYVIASVPTRLVTFFLIFGIHFVQGYVSGRRILKIWFGHVTKTVSMLPCYKLESPSGLLDMK